MIIMLFLTLHTLDHKFYYNYKKQEEKTGITSLLVDLKKAGITLKDLDTNQTSLEEIFVDIVRK